MTLARSTVSLCAIHLIGNGMLLYLGYYWLGLGESDAAHLAFSAAVLLIFAMAAIWLHATALVLFRKAEALTLSGCARRALRNILPLLVLAIMIVLIYAGLLHLYDSFGHAAFVIGSYSTLTLRRPVAPTNVLAGFHFLIWLFRWLIVPVFALPLASEVASRGWTGFQRSSFRRSRKVVFWIGAGLLLVAAVHLPLHLFLWIPKVSSFAMEVVSVTLRLGLGYLLFTAGLLALEYFTSAGSPPGTHANTVVSP